MKTNKKVSKEISGRMGYLLPFLLITFISSLRAQSNASEYNDNVPLPLGATNSAGFGSGALMNAANVGSNNSALGKDALNGNINGNRNTAIGMNALLNNDGDDNTAAGFEALRDNTSGTRNTAAGYQALANNTIGDDNTAIGYQALLTVTSDNENSGLGSGADVNAGESNQTSIGFQAFPGIGMSNIFSIGNGNVTLIETAVAITYASDARFKDNVRVSDVKGLTFIKKLKPVIYNLDVEKITKYTVRNLSPERQTKYLKTDYSAGKSLRRSGFIAQEVEEAANSCGFEFRGLIKPDAKNDAYLLIYSQFVMPLVLAVQEQQEMIVAFENKLALRETLVFNELNKEKIATKINEIEGTSSKFDMQANRPNPFTVETVIDIQLPHHLKTAELIVSDLTGKEVLKYILIKRGSISTTVYANTLKPGIFIYTVVADGMVLGSKKMLVAE